MVGVFKRIALALGGIDDRGQREEEPGNARCPDGRVVAVGVGRNGWVRAGLRDH